MFVDLFVCLSLCLFVCLSVCSLSATRIERVQGKGGAGKQVSVVKLVFASLCVCLFDCLFVCLFACLLVCLSLCLSVCYSDWERARLGGALKQVLCFDFCCCLFLCLFHCVFRGPVSMGESLATCKCVLGVWIFGERACYGEQVPCFLPLPHFL